MEQNILVKNHLQQNPDSLYTCYLLAVICRLSGRLRANEISQKKASNMLQSSAFHQHVFCLYQDYLKLKKKLAYFRINGRRIPIHGVCVGELCSPACCEYQIDCYYSTLLTLLGTQNFKTTELTLSPFKPDLYTKGSF